MCFCILIYNKKDCFTIVPVLVRTLKQDGKKLDGQILSKYLMDPANLFVMSSDFCHLGKQDSLKANFNCFKPFHASKYQIFVQIAKTYYSFIY